MKITNIIMQKKRELFLVTFFMLLGQIISQGIPTIIKYISDFLTDFNPEIVIILVTSLVLAGFVKYFSTILADKYYWQFTNSIGLILIRDFIKVVLKSNKEVFSRLNPDELHRMATGDINNLKNGIIKKYFMGLSTCIEAVTLIAFVLFLDFRLGIITILWYLIFFFISKKIIDNIVEERKSERASYTDIMSLTKDAIYGNFDLKYYASSEGFFNTLDRVNRRYISSHVKLMIRQSFSRYITFIGNFTNIAIIILYKAHVVNEISTGTLLAMYMYSMNYASIFRNILSLRTFSKDVEALKQPVEDFFEIANKKGSGSDHIITSVDKISLKSLGVEFDGNTVFDNLNWEFSRGNVYLINGDSGAGKSTLINALIGEIQRSGSVYYNEFELNTLDHSVLGRKIGIVRQNMYLINGTVRENIRLYNEYSDAEIDDVTRLLNINNLDQEIGTSEIETVSGGERKRIALARLLLSIDSKDVVILDETFANIDMNSITALSQTIRMKSEDKILIIVTHDLAVRSLFKDAKVLDLNALQVLV